MSLKSILKRSFIGAVLAVNAMALASSFTRTNELFSDKEKGFEFSAKNAAVAAFVNMDIVADDWNAYAERGEHSAKMDGWVQTPDDAASELFSKAEHALGMTNKAAGIVNGSLGLVYGVAGFPGEAAGSLLNSSVQALNKSARPAAPG